jgi:hypothetical protein
MKKIRLNEKEIEIVLRYLYDKKNIERQNGNYNLSIELTEIILKIKKQLEKQ